MTWIQLGSVHGAKMCYDMGTAGVCICKPGYMGPR